MLSAGSLDPACSFRANTQREGIYNNYINMYIMPYISGSKIMLIAKCYYTLLAFRLARLYTQRANVTFQQPYNNVYVDLNTGTGIFYAEDQHILHIHIGFL